MWGSSLALAFVVTGCAPVVEPARSPQTQAIKAELARHQGTWIAVSSRRDGKDAAPEVVASIRRIVQGDRVVWTRDGKRFAATTLVLDPARVPKALDVIPDGGPARGQRVSGIYRLDGDRLTICMADAGTPRPTDFSAEADEPRTLMLFRRASGDDGKANPQRADQEPDRGPGES
jgi:uncharacterized protein (TIGR03067 family)